MQDQFSRVAVHLLHRSQRSNPSGAFTTREGVATPETRVAFVRRRFSRLGLARGHKRNVPYGFRPWIPNLRVYGALPRVWGWPSKGVVWSGMIGTGKKHICHVGCMSADRLRRISNIPKTHPFQGVGVGVGGGGFVRCPFRLVIFQGKTHLSRFIKNLDPAITLSRFSSHVNLDFSTPADLRGGTGRTGWRSG